jgi:hypothetical protein
VYAVGTPESVPYAEVLNTDVEVKVRVAFCKGVLTKLSSAARLPAESEVIAEEELEKIRLTSRGPFAQEPEPVLIVRQEMLPGTAEIESVETGLGEAVPHAPCQ